MRILLTGGGTGGHIYPALAIGAQLQSLYPQAEFLYVGTKQGLEGELVGQTEIPFQAIHAQGLPRKLNVKLVQALLRTAYGFVEALGMIGKFNPDLVIGTGGFVCGPVSLAAKLRGKKVIIHEQNAFPGVTNKILARIVDQVMINFADSARYFPDKEKLVQTGLPVRKNIGRHDQRIGRAHFGLEDCQRVILITGGSRGARTINMTVAEAYPALLAQEGLGIIHITGQEGYGETIAKAASVGIDVAAEKRLVLRPYLHDMDYGLAAADLVVGRAGATFLSEITVCGLPSILVPFPFASENHQEYNATALSSKQAAVMILNKDFTKERLLEALVPFLQDQDYLNNMAKSAHGLAQSDSMERIIAVTSRYLNQPSENGR